MKPSVLVILLVVFILGSSLCDASQSAPPFCQGKCQARCAKAGKKDNCLRYCGICCAKCKCVPSGTYGNKHECPCYNNLKNSKGTSKCP